MVDQKNNSYKIGDCSKNQLIKINKTLIGQVQGLQQHLNSNNILLQVTMCALRQTDPDNGIFKLEQGVLTETEIAKIDKPIENGDYDKYRQVLRDSYIKGEEEKDGGEDNV